MWDPIGFDFGFSLGLIVNVKTYDNRARSDWFPGRGTVSNSVGLYVESDTAISHVQNSTLTIAERTAPKI